MTTSCMECGKSMRLTEQQAEKLECKGMHFLILDENDAGIPIRDKGLIAKSGAIMEKVEYGLFVEVGSYSELSGCRIGNHTKIGPHVVIEKDVVIGNNCEIKGFVFIPEGTRIGDNVFIGPGTVLTNDKSPRATGKWKMAPVTIEDYASIGAGVIVRPGVTLRRGGVAHDGAIISHDVGSP